MNIAAFLLILAAIFIWGIISGRAAVISTPIFFVAVGLVLGAGLNLVQVDSDPHSTKLFAEVTLVWVLFADASRIRFAELREDLGHYARLLVIGLPLTVALGMAAAATVLDLSLWYALLVGAALAPTDAALGSAVMSDRRVSYRVRQTLNVESGLNDGIVTPIVTVSIAAIAAEAGLRQEGSVHPLLGLLLGALIGAVLGALGGALLRSAGRRGWSSEESAGPSILALALLAYLLALLVEANGFVAAFVAGSAFGAVARQGGEKEVYYVEQTCGLASMICWLLFGAIGLPTIAADWSWRILLYALLSLTVIRMLPVVISLLGRANGLAHGLLHWLVRAPRTGFHRVRSNSAGRPSWCTRSYRRRGRNNWLDRPAQRCDSRTDRATAGGTVRSHPASRCGADRTSGADAATPREPVVEELLILPALRQRAAVLRRAISLPSSHSNSSTTAASRASPHCAKVKLVVPSSLFKKSA